MRAKVPFLFCDNAQESELGFVTWSFLGDLCVRVFGDMCVKICGDVCVEIKEKKT